MAATVLISRMNDSHTKPVHPFFVKPQKDIPVESHLHVQDASSNDARTTDNSTGDQQQGNLDDEAQSDESSATTNTHTSKKRAHEINDLFEKQDEPGEIAIKKLKLEQATDQPGQLSAPMSVEGCLENNPDRKLVQVVIPVAKRDIEAQEIRGDVAEAQNAPSSIGTEPPPKLMKLSSRGTIGSPPKPKTDAIVLLANSQKKSVRGRSRKRASSRASSVSARTKPSILVTIKYSLPETASRIEGILSSTPQDQTNQVSPSADTKTALSVSQIKVIAPPAPPKITHPFFLKPTKQVETQNIPVAKAAPEVVSNPEKPQSLKVSGFTSFARTPKQAPGKEAPWPWKGAAHVSDSVPLAEIPVSPSIATLTLPMRKKEKQVAVKIFDEENILLRFEEENLKLDPFRPHNGPSNVDIETSGDISNQLYSHATPVSRVSLRIPHRYTGSGIQFQKANIRQMQSVAINEVAQIGNLHPGVRSLYNRLSNSLSAFDNNRCESQTWLQKYAPCKAEQILQDGTEAMELKQWLNAMTVNVVDSGKKPSVSTSGQRDKTPAKKRKRKSGMDDFIVDEDDLVMEDEVEWTDLENSTTTAFRPANNRSQVRRAGQNYTRPFNAVLLSGPHGSGKTATVYAVAKELGFEVFEINSGLRRSGKDILDKIGDMAENHLVQQISRAVEKADSTKPSKIVPHVETAVSEGIQWDVASFFTAPRGEAKNTSKQKATVQKSSTSGSAARQQKQSLILLEEVDVLFAEDKQFWTTILALVLHSRRPIILTCNDESKVPLNALALHAVLRLVPPSQPLAVDYLRLMAACEGHAITNDALCHLYNVCRRDLRKSISSLNFWCQMAIGTSMAGLDWMVVRYPPGVDIDGSGHKLRCISGQTYLPGMETFGIDGVTKASNGDSTQTELNLGKSIRELGLTIEEFDVMQHVGDLSSYDQLAEQLSALDVFGTGDLSTGLKAKLDSSHPEPTEKLKKDNLDGAPYLPSEPFPNYHLQDSAIAAAMISLIQKLHTKGHATDQSSTQQQCIDSVARNAVRSLCSVKTQLRRTDFSLALDILAEDDTSFQDYCTISSFDREFSVITQDIAPYVRQIAKQDMMLEEERAGQLQKRSRMSRVSRSAAEGGRREEQRRERWFNKDLNLQLVLRTGNPAWSDSDPIEVPTFTNDGVLSDMCRYW